MDVAEGEEGALQRRRGGAGAGAGDGGGGAAGGDGEGGAGGVGGAAGGDVGGQAVQLEAALLQLPQLLQLAGEVSGQVRGEQRPLVAVGRASLLRPHDAGGPVQVEHVDQLLLLLLQLLDLGLQLGVDALQLLRLL